ncbi:MAG: PEP-CTERM sorting domain-containing protein [Phycisphaeraceae bacterium]
MKLASKMFFVLAILGLISAANASVTINFVAAGLSNAAGNPLPEGSMFVVLLDPTGNGFGDLTDPTSFTGNGEAIELGRFATNDTEVGVPGAIIGAVQFDWTSQINGKPLMYVWYDMPFSPLATGPGGGVDGGFYRTDAVVAEIGSNIGFNVPPDGWTVALNAYTPEYGGPADLQAGDGHTNGFTTTVPEPASMALLALGGLAVLARRRKA